ncbi:hypothetical protein [Cyanobacterium aponinum]|uniref:hypothetical protein n=1 Tax=Cyanobacterium aponinum TaxID=379064 RepID=UPI000C12D71E|nr:hypothetical protein [Cyanobacterium aponinum]PHV60999.1 hypothetical protein CSQ80_17965 [Cyanobacterium aponinum IPPAS B-1201]
MNQKEHNNSILIYNYVEKRIQEVNEGLYKTSQKLATIIGFVSILLKFVSETSSCYPSLLLTKSISIICLMGSLYYCINGLLPNPTGGTIKSQELVEDWWYKSDEETKLFIIRQWIKAINEMYDLYNKKTYYVKRAIIFIALSSLLFGINILLVNYFPCS